jgi:predicted transport protein
MPKSPEEMEAAMVANLAEKTGRSLDEWLAVARAGGETKHGAIVARLKGEHGLTHGYANLVAHRLLRESAAPSAGGEPDLVAAQYAGKEHLRPIYDRVLEVVGGFGDDIEVAPKKTYVSLRRGRQFAIVQPATKKRLDLGIDLREDVGSPRLSGSAFSGMVSHKLGVESVAEVDDEVVGWLRRAYERA